MTTRTRWLWLVLFSLGLGWFEGAVVVYLRELGPPVGSSLPSIVLPRHVLATEVVREAASLLVLGSVSILAGTSGLQRFAAFLVAFGVWDLVYYLTLHVVTGWPARLSDPDVLFLIPVPWVGPVWAPALVALVFVGAGSYVFLTPSAARVYRTRDWLVELAAAAGVVASFLPLPSGPWTEPRAEAFTPWLYWIGLGLGLGWFVNAEWRERAGRR
ncbi:MAG: hypothetical protein AB7Q16_11985 [Vicinamibacterales bacterium]